MSASLTYPARQLAAMAALTAVCLGSSANALEPGALRESLFGARPTAADPRAAQPVARYVSQEGDVFVLDRSQPRPLLKFDDNPEVWVLRPQLAPRGDVLYMNDLGEPVLRATRLGGLTLFTNDRPGGTAAAVAGAGQTLRLAQLGPQQLLPRLPRPRLLGLLHRASHPTPGLLLHHGLQRGVPYHSGLAHQGAGH